MDTSVQIVLALVQSAHQKWLSLIAETGYSNPYWAKSAMMATLLMEMAAPCSARSNMVGSALITKNVLISKMKIWDHSVVMQNYKEIMERPVMTATSWVKMDAAAPAWWKQGGSAVCTTHCKIGAIVNEWWYRNSAEMGSLRANRHVMMGSPWMTMMDAVKTARSSQDGTVDPLMLLKSFPGAGKFDTNDRAKLFIWWPIHDLI